MTGIARGCGNNPASEQKFRAVSCSDLAKNAVTGGTKSGAAAKNGVPGGLG
jgi:hypothetical protein